ncbi:MAG: GNAT family N-acetyltransferase [Gelidibacter sp.]
MKTAVHLIQAKASDLEITYKIFCTSLKPYLEKLWDWDEVHQRKIHKKKFKPSKTNLIEFEEQIVGFMVLSEKEKEFYIENLLIDQTFQNLGIGTEVMQRMIQKSISEKKNIRLQVFKINTKAQKFYQDLEFKKTSENEFNFEMKRSF